jgi:uncharacterized protein YoaH (UPF0181 family)
MITDTGRLLTRRSDIYVSHELGLFILAGQIDSFVRKPSDSSPVIDETPRTRKDGGMQFTTEIGIIPFGSVNDEDRANLLEKSKPVEMELGKTLEIRINNTAEKVTVCDKLTWGATSVNFSDLCADVRARLEKPEVQIPSVEITKSLSEIQRLVANGVSSGKISQDVADKVTEQVEKAQSATIQILTI